MGLSDKLGALNYEPYQADNRQRPFSYRECQTSIVGFKGDVYQGLDAESMDAEDLAWATNLRILSGLYGLLRPLDLMQPYRLEMGTKFANQRGGDLYAFWGDLITRKINQHLEGSKEPVLLNLASNEYFKSVHQRRLTHPLSRQCLWTKKTINTNY